jgi:hypothetical protein
MAEAESASRLTRRWAAKLGWNLDDAGKLLLGVANTLGQETEPNLKIVARDDFERALRLTRFYSEEVVLKARSALGTPAPTPDPSRRRHWL